MLTVCRACRGFCSAIAGAIVSAQLSNSCQSRRVTMTNAQKRTPIALITGGSRGLGRSMALHLAERGVDIILTYRKAAAEARGVCDRVHAFGRKAVALTLDVTDSASFNAFGKSV